MLTAFGGFLAIGLVLPVLPRYVTGPVGGGEVAAGVVFGAFAVAALVTRPLAGRLVDRRGPRPVVEAGLIASSLASALLLVPLGVPWLIFARLVVGAAEGLIAVGGTIWSIELSPADRHGRAIGLFGLSMWIGLSVGALVGEGLFRLASFEAVWVAAAAAPIAGLLIARATDAPAHPVVGLVERQPLLPPRGAIAPGLVLCLSGYGYAALTGFVVLHLDASGAGGGAVALAVFSLTVVVARLAAGDLPDRLGGRRGAVVALCAQAAGLGVIAASASLAPAIVGACLAGFATSLMFPSLALMVLERVAPERRASAIGGFSAFLDAGVAASGPATGAFAAGAGFDVAFAVAAALAAAAAIALSAAPVASRVRARRLTAVEPAR